MKKRQSARVISDFMRGVVNTLRVMGASMLYRHPYRTSAEGFRADWRKIGDDIESVFGRIMEEGHGRR